MDKAIIKRKATRFFTVLGVLFFALLLWAGISTAYKNYRARQEARAPEAMVLSLDFSQAIQEKPKAFALSLPALLEPPEGTTLFATVRAIEAAKDDPRVKGLVALFSPDQSPTLVQAQEIGAALRHFRESGKPAIAFASSYGSFGPSGSLYPLASQLDAVWLQPVGAVGLAPLSIEAPFGKTALAKIGVQADFLRREEYKSVMENVARDSFSPPVRANMESLMTSLQDQTVDLIAKGRKIAPKQAAALIANGPYTANEALKAGLVTKLGYDDEILDLFTEKAGKDAAYVGPDAYLGYRANEAKDDETKADVALIYAEGMIVDAAAKGPYRYAEDDVIDTQELVGAFEDAAKDEKIKAILFRVDSPGGSPTASESIRRALIKAKQSGKPVFVSMGRVAASGGYWISMDASRIIADPGTLTGSIGVVAGKFVLGGLFDKLGIAWDSIGSSEASRLWSPRQPFGPKEEARMNAMLDETYAAFTSNVAAARKIAPEKMPAIAKGRVFSGAQALKAGLVDELGGMAETVAAIKKELKLAPTDKIALYPFPAPETPESFAKKILKNLGLDFDLFSESSSLGALQPAAADLRRLRGALAALDGLRRELGPLWTELTQTDPVRASLPVVFQGLGQ